MMQHAFQTPILQRDIPGTATLNAMLKEKILARRASGDKGVKKSNAGLTWHSNYDMTKWCKPAIGDLTAHMQAACMEFAGGFGAKSGDKMSMSFTPWAMVSEGQGDYAAPHTHPRCQFACVYYVDVGEPDFDRFAESGKLELLDPRSGWSQCDTGRLQFSPRVLITPQPSKLVCFPAPLSHMVHPFFGKGTRIAIAANCSVTGYEKAEAK